MTTTPERIDFVYTWVDGADPDYAALRNDWAGRHGIPPNPERDRDNLDLLKYSLRSLERHVPWFGNLYLVTARPQVPRWLNLSGPSRIRIVHHDEIFANPDVLPTFNSFAIEHNLHRIDGLSRYFIYLNDDYLFGRGMRKRDFITPDGRIRIYLEREFTPGAEEWETTHDPYGKAISNTNRFLDRLHGKTRRRHGRHAPLLIDRSLLPTDEPEIRQTITNRFRCGTDLAFEYAYAQSVLARRGVPSFQVPLWEVYLTTVFHRVTNDLRVQKRVLRWIRILRPKFYCLNDDMGDFPDPRVVRLLRDFLERVYPEKSSFEK
jgi:hypothetical protein